MEKKQKSYFSLKARETVLKELSRNKIPLSKKKIDDFVNYSIEASITKTQITEEMIDKKIQLGTISKTRGESIKKGLKVQDLFKNKNNQLMSNEGLVAKMVENEWKENADLRSRVQAVLDCNGGVIPKDKSNGLLNDKVVIGYAEKLGMETKDFVHLAMRGLTTGELKRRGRPRTTPYKRKSKK